MNLFKDIQETYRELEEKNKEIIEKDFPKDKEAKKEDDRIEPPFFESFIVYIMHDLYSLPWWFFTALLLYLFSFWYVAIMNFINAINKTFQTISKLKK